MVIRSASAFRSTPRGCRMRRWVIGFALGATARRLDFALRWTAWVAGRWRIVFMPWGILMLAHMLLRVQEWPANRSVHGKVPSISGAGGEHIPCQYRFAHGSGRWRVQEANFSSHRGNVCAACGPMNGGFSADRQNLCWRPRVATLDWFYFVDTRGRPPAEAWRIGVKRGTHVARFSESTALCARRRFAPDALAFCAFRTGC